MPCKISSVLRVIEHISTQSVVSLSASKSFQGAEEFTQSPDLSVGGIGNCKDKSLQQLKSGFLFSRAFGISQISQIRPCPLLLSETWPCPLPPSKRKMVIWGVCVGGNSCRTRCPLLNRSHISAQKIQSCVSSFLWFAVIWSYSCYDRHFLVVPQKKTCKSNFYLLLNLLQTEINWCFYVLRRFSWFWLFPLFVSENVNSPDAWFPEEEWFANISTDFLFHLSLYK